MIAPALDFANSTPEVFDRIADVIARDGYVIVDQALPAPLVDALFVQLSALPETALSRAGIGREAQQQSNPFVRRDEICWLDPCMPASVAFFEWMEQLRLGINRQLFLGLFDFEAHFARYEVGAFYKRHLDAFDGFARNRVLSVVLYLNPAWQPSDAGELVLYAPGEQGETVETVQPVYGRLAVFLSERFPHEVLPTNTARFSIAGWFRVNGSVAGIVDPAR